MAVTGEARVLLLTGRPGAGKTTVLARAAGLLPGRLLGGFLTREIREAGERKGFALETFDGERRLLAHVDVPASRARVGRYGVDLAALDGVAGRALAPDRAAVFLVDEVGKMECLSERFVAAMERLLASGKPVVATVALRGQGFPGEIKRRPGTDLWTVTTGVRDGLPARVAAWIEKRLP